MFKNFEGVEYETPYAVICPKHGRQYLTESYYMAQLYKPNNTWVCPHGCRRNVQWDDNCPQTNPPEEALPKL